MCVVCGVYVCGVCVASGGAGGDEEVQRSYRQVLQQQRPVVHQF